jgi:RimJ/RimL family protein N-acetyltransferase
MLRTSRLDLRAHTLADFEPLAAMWADPEVVRYIGNRTSTREDSWARLLRYRGHWELLGYGFWAIEERATGEYIGDIGIGEYCRDIDAAFPVAIAGEAGWTLVRAAHGKGYATEALEAVLAWARGNLAQREVSAIVDPDNQASLRVARKCGFVETGRARYRGDTIIVLRAAL